MATPPCSYQECNFLSHSLLYFDFLFTFLVPPRKDNFSSVYEKKRILCDYFLQTHKTQEVNTTYEAQEASKTYSLQGLCTGCISRNSCWEEDPQLSWPILRQAFQWRPAFQSLLIYSFCSESHGFARLDMGGIISLFCQGVLSGMSRHLLISFQEKSSTKRVGSEGKRKNKEKMWILILTGFLGCCGQRKEQDSKKKNM